MINATQIRKGMVIKVEGELYKVLEATHITPGKGQALMQTKLRKLKDQTLLDNRFRSKDKVEQAYLEKIEMATNRLLDEFRSLYRQGKLKSIHNGPVH